MAYLELSAEMEQSIALACQDTLESLGALAVSLLDAGDNPLLEPLPGTTPLWQSVKVVGLFAEHVSYLEINEQLKARFPHIAFQYQRLDDQDWTRAWLAHFKPMHFGNRLWVMPHEYPNPLELSMNAVILKLDPGLAFGTGTHPTTALCLTWLAQQNLQQKTLIDYGCGSGILGIAGLLLGAKEVYGVDYDPQALIASRDNAQRNDIVDEALKTILPQEMPSISADCIMANILANPLIELAPVLSSHAKPGCDLILSGLLTDQADAVQAAYRPWFRFEKSWVDEDWVLLIAQRLL